VAKFRVKKSNELQFETDVVINNTCWLGAGSVQTGRAEICRPSLGRPTHRASTAAGSLSHHKKVLFQLPSSLLMSLVEMSFMGLVLKWGVLGWIKMCCIS